MRTRLKLSNLLLLLSFRTFKHMSVASRTILSNFCEEQCPQSHPQYLLGLSRALFPTITFLEIAVCTTYNTVPWITLFSSCTVSRLSNPPDLIWILLILF